MRSPTDTFVPLFEILRRSMGSFVFAARWAALFDLLLSAAESAIITDHHHPSFLAAQTKQSFAAVASTVSCFGRTF